MSSTPSSPCAHRRCDETYGRRESSVATKEGRKIGAPTIGRVPMSRPTCPQPPFPSKIIRWTVSCRARCVYRRRVRWRLGRIVIKGERSVLCSQGLGRSSKGACLRSLAGVVVRRLVEGFPRALQHFTIDGGLPFHLAAQQQQQHGSQLDLVYYLLDEICAGTGPT
jgi:hypothetical protein